MSWMTKEGSSSASGQSPPHSPLNELAQLSAASTRHDGATAARWDCVLDGGYNSQAGGTTQSADSRSSGVAVGKSPGKGVVYPSEGFS
jgi:hypothetical protein